MLRISGFGFTPTFQGPPDGDLMVLNSAHRRGYPVGKGRILYRGLDL